MEIQVKGTDWDEVKAEAKRLVSQNPHYSDAVDSSMVGKVSVFTIKVKSKLEVK